MGMILAGISLGRPRLLGLLLSTCVLGVVSTDAALADEARDILVKAIKAGEQITAGELKVTLRGTRDVDMKPEEIGSVYVGDLAFDHEAKLLRWSVGSPFHKTDIAQHVIATPGECFYQQGLTMRTRSRSRRLLGNHRELIDVRILGRAPLDLVQERKDLPKVLEFFDGANIRLVKRLPEDDDSVARIVHIYQGFAREQPDKTFVVYHVEARYRIDTAKNVITEIQYSGVFENSGMIDPLHTDRFTWEEVDGVLVPVKCERRGENRIAFDYLLEWKTVNKVDKARFDVKDLPPLDPMQITIEYDEIDGKPAKVNYPPGFEKGRKPKPTSPPSDASKAQ